VTNTEMQRKTLFVKWVLNIRKNCYKMGYIWIGLLQVAHGWKTEDGIV
jgi:hypothetical protein